MNFQNILVTYGCIPSAILTTFLGLMDRAMLFHLPNLIVFVQQVKSDASEALPAGCIQLTTAQM